MRKMWWFVLVALLLVVGCREPIVTPTAVILPAPSNTPEPTELPEPTVTPYPTATPEGWEPTPTRAVVEDTDSILVVIFDPEADDGVRVRSAPGYECDTGDPNCNWVSSEFPSESQDEPDLHALIEVDETDPDQAWCKYVGNYAVDVGWAACQYLVPIDETECQVAEELEIADILKACEE